MVSKIEQLAPAHSGNTEREAIHTDAADLALPALVAGLVDPDTLSTPDRSHGRGSGHLRWI